jgi:hypothetical protein
VLISRVTIPLGISKLRSSTTSIKPNWLTASTGVYKPEIVTPQPIHVRVHHSDASRGCNHRFDCVTAIGQHPSTRLRGQVMRRCHCTAKSRITLFNNHVENSQPPEECQESQNQPPNSIKSTRFSA